MHDELNEIIKKALDEDIKTGDITTIACVSQSVEAEGTLLIKQDGVIAGLEAAAAVFNFVDQTLLFEIYKKDGDEVKEGEIAGKATGKAASILTAERTVLNILQRMSGIATFAKTFQDKVKHTKAKIIDTRKTAPGLRYLDKLAVKLGGCENHRIGLYDMYLIKDNHIEAAGSLSTAVRACKEHKSKTGKNYKIEVECSSIKQVEEAIAESVDIIMLDNFKTSEMEKAVKLINGRCKVEASGMVNLDTVKAIAGTGVDYISVGALTHSVKAMDISLKIKNIE
jgi:nicotinate-nucleotide pyrophosphorylase (carboxylating)